MESAHRPFTLALTVRDPSVDVAHDVLVRGTTDQTIGDLARYVAAYLGRPAQDDAGTAVAYGLHVARTGEQLRREANIGAVDLLEGDITTLVVPRGVSPARPRPRWAEADPEGRVIPFPRP